MHIYLSISTLKSPQIQKFPGSNFPFFLSLSLADTHATMATWTARPAAQGTPASSWEEPGSPDSAPSTVATPSPTHSPCMDSSDPMEDSGFHDWLGMEGGTAGAYIYTCFTFFLIDF